MIRIKFGISKRRANKWRKSAHKLGYLQGTRDGEQQVIYNLRQRIELLNPDFPVPVSELRKWVNLND